MFLNVLSTEALGCNFRLAFGGFIFLFFLFKVIQMYMLQSLLSKDLLLLLLFLLIVEKNLFQAYLFFAVILCVCGVPGFKYLHKTTQEIKAVESLIWRENVCIFKVKNELFLFCEFQRQNFDFKKRLKIKKIIELSYYREPSNQYHN